MTQPTPYTRLYDFSDFQTVNPSRPLPATELDAELDALKLTTDDLRGNLALIQRDDGALANLSVSPESLSAGALAMIHQGEYNPRGAWAAATAYALGDVIGYNGATYLAIIAGTSTASFANDNTAGRWLLIANGALQGGGQAVDLYSGNGTQTAFTLSFNYVGNNAATVFVAGVAQIPGQDFTIVGSALTLVTAPPAPAVAGRKNVMVRGTGVEAQLAADAATTAATNSQGYASAALASQTAAGSSQAAAAASATTAAAQAATATTQATTATTKAAEASTSATNAAASAASASTSATTATTQATTATTQATTATTQATTATAQATSAAGSALAASNSATNAAGSATTANIRASDATAAANTATTQATNASGSATAAAGSATTASTSATSAINSATSAATSNTNAGASASSAANSASNAATSATSSAGSATTATTQATTATTQATNASASATAAATSATSASTSATSASTSATAASGSATAAAASAASIDIATYVRRDSATGAATVPAGTTAQRPGTVAVGQFRFNSTLGKFEGYNGAAWGAVGGGATGGSSDAVFVENDQAVTANYTITANKNAMSTGPISVAGGVVVTVPTGSRWVVL